MEEVKMSNMYRWITENGFTYNPLAGECPHSCSYCYMHQLRKRFKNIAKKYTGKLRIDEKELKKNLGSGKTVFVCSTNDLFASEVPQKFIMNILEHINKYPDNTYLFQSKNPIRMYEYFDMFPPNTILGTTIETNRDYKLTKAPPPFERYKAMKFLKKKGGNRFIFMISIEPVLDFDYSELIGWIKDIKPEFISIGADSKGNNLPEPNRAKVLSMISELSLITEIRLKKNIKRILGDEYESCIASYCREG